MSNSLATPSRFNALATLWRDVVASWRNALASVQVEPPLDDSTLRDLGLSHSELLSFTAEADGLAAPTRLRVIRRLTNAGAGVRA